MTQVLEGAVSGSYALTFSPHHIEAELYQGTQLCLFGKLAHRGSFESGEDGLDFDPLAISSYVSCFMFHVWFAAKTERCLWVSRSLIFIFVCRGIE